MRYVIGIDAGGTGTVGLLADETGRVLRDARAGGANLVVHGELGVEKVLYQVIDALDAPGPVAAACLGMAGVDRPEETEVMRGVLRRLGLRGAVRIVNDAVVALVAGAPAGGTCWATRARPSGSVMRRCARASAPPTAGARRRASTSASAGRSASITRAGW
jgi:N-acetylglucosamine kinase-like BadF-type ATPase